MLYFFDEMSIWSDFLYCFPYPFGLPRGPERIENMCKAPRGGRAEGPDYGLRPCPRSGPLGPGFPTLHVHRLILYRMFCIWAPSSFPNHQASIREDSGRKANEGGAASVQRKRN